MDNKTCNSDCSCKYKIYDLFNRCSYSGFCDFQAPRDSRAFDCTSKLTFPDPCTCGSIFKCKQHDKTDATPRPSCGDKASCEG